MTRILPLAVAQLGPIQPGEDRQSAVRRLIALLRQAHGHGCELVVFPECALTPFFPHWLISDEAELDSYYEREMPGPATQALFEEARRLRMAFCLGYAELVIDSRNGTRKRRFNTSILVDRGGQVVGKYRKIHLPGYAEPQAGHPYQNLEKRYFEVGDLGFGVWKALECGIGMCICNDRRWAETYRVLALQGAELVLLGYNTPAHVPGYPQLDHLGLFHNQLSMQAGAYQNSMWVAAAAKAGVEAGVSQIGGSCIIAPSGQIVASSIGLGDELLVARCDLDEARMYREFVFNFGAHRRVEHYGLIVEQTGRRELVAGAAGVQGSTGPVK